MTADADRPRRFMEPSAPVRLAWRARSSSFVGERSLLVDVDAERFEPAMEVLTGVPAELASGPLGPPTRARLQVDAWSDHVLRLRWSPEGDIPAGDTPMLVGTPGPLASFDRLEVDADGATGLRTTAMTVRVEPDPLRLVVTGPDGSVLVATRAPDHAAIQRQDRLWDRTAQRWLYLNRHAYPLGSSEGSMPTSAFISFELRHDEHIYGLGEGFGAVDRKGTEARLWTSEAFTNASPIVYKPVPFCLSTRGYGLFVNSSHAMQVHAGDLDPTALSWIVADTTALDIFLIVGPGLPDVLRRYAELTGAPAVPPRWTFGLWLSRCTYESQDDVLGAARTAREREMPADVINIDTGWFEREWVCDWRFGSRFPSPETMVRELQELGFHVCLWQWPYVGVDSAAFAEARDAGVLVRRVGGEVLVLPGRNGPDVAILDYSDPTARRWIEARLRPLLESGISLFQADFGEAAPADGVYAGIASEAAHNAYPLLYGQTMWEAIERTRGSHETVIWARSAWAGSQRYPVHWSGDGLARFEDLACVLRATLSMGLSGFPFYSHDIGGFLGVPSAEVYARWAQLGLFSSHSRVHGLSPREPWAFGERVEAIVRRTAELRYQLMPYLWTEALECGRTGLPMVRALVLEDPADPTVRAIDDQYLLGRDLLVAPILDDRDRRLVYLPRGRWVDHATGEGWDGRQWIEVLAPLERLPLFVRAGAILPLAPPMQHVDERPLDPLTLEIREPAPEGRSLVRDPGGDISVSYALQGDRLDVRVTGAPGEFRVTVPGRATKVEDSRTEGLDRVVSLRLR